MCDVISSYCSRRIVAEVALGVGRSSSSGSQVLVVAVAVVSVE